ncbi:MAG: flagellar hook-basal body complex protein FliE [Sulfobacillus acidophilus]|uniref:Flagellar hook-basal body complex protein FliE n=1 Tax=Sulfobacillus acidophilus TaxID=53633 RepID=A0A2T2WM71_9FIRM|nr:MAG: flagellar hook-basal body complex protein FliE [Sulfobacillus acidophilus]
MSTLPITLLPPVTLSGSEAQQQGLSSNFGALLGQAITGLTQGQANADQTIQQALVGNVSVTQAMIAMTQAQSQLDVATAIQNQAVSAYQTIMNMPLS